MTFHQALTTIQKCTVIINYKDTCEKKIKQRRTPGHHLAQPAFRLVCHRALQFGQTWEGGGKKFPTGA